MQTTLQLSPLLVTKLNQLGADLYGLNGLDSVPASTPEFLARLQVILTSARTPCCTLSTLCNSARHVAHACADHGACAQPTWTRPTRSGT